MDNCGFKPGELVYVNILDDYSLEHGAVAVSFDGKILLIKNFTPIFVVKDCYNAPIDDDYGVLILYENMLLMMDNCWLSRYKE